MQINLTSLILSGLTSQQKMSWGINGLIIGLGTVFAILVILIVVINLLRLTASDKKKSRSKNSINAVIGPIEKTYDHEDEVIAAIAAAISCMASREGKRFAIKSYRRIGVRNNRNY